MKLQAGEAPATLPRLDRWRSLRKVVALLAVVAFAVAFAACGSDSGDSSTAANAQATSDEGGGATSAKANAQANFDKEHPGSAEFGSPPLEFEADPGGDLAYTADEVTAKEGNVTIEFTNPQPTPHNVKVEALPSHGSVTTRTIKDGFDAITITLNAKEKFIFYCTVPGHRKAGMEGIVKVKPR
jgi:plastocyanin